MKHTIIAILITLVAGAVFTNAQTRQPSTAIRPFLVETKQSLDELEKKLSTVNKAEVLIGGTGMETQVSIQHDVSKNGDPAELHDASDDVYYVLKGEATLELGGKLVDPKEVSPGEWRSKIITGAQTVVIKEGDLVMVPRGTVHRRTVNGKGFSMILIKIYEDPLPAK
jgi:mannose-6-phosphate isomerase-like protein (cupin superfamily)